MHRVISPLHHVSSLRDAYLRTGTLPLSYLPGNRGSVPGGGRDVSLYHRIQPGSRVHAASYPPGTGSFFLGVKPLRREADHSPLRVVSRLSMCGAMPQFVVMAWCLINEGQGQFVPIYPLTTNRTALHL
jgi:hypothetical protein